MLWRILHVSVLITINISIVRLNITYFVIVIDELADLMTLRDVYLEKSLDVRIHLCHVSTIDSLEAVRRGKKEGVKVTCEVTPHHIALWDNSYRVNPPSCRKAACASISARVK